MCKTYKDYSDYSILEQMPENTCVENDYSCLRQFGSCNMVRDYILTHSRNVSVLNYPSVETERNLIKTTNAYFNSIGIF